MVTNCHVLAGAISAVAHIPDGRSAVILGTMVVDEARDIVVAEISDTSASPSSVRSDLPRKGESVTALDTPLGLSFTATRGSISAIRMQAEMGPDHKGTWVQVDAPLSPGNSGGPLINSAGEVVAMSTLASQGIAQSLNFGISSRNNTEAVEKARYAARISLASGVGKVNSKSDRGGSAGDGAILSAARIAPDTCEAYFSQGIRDFSNLTRGLRSEAARLASDLKECEREPTQFPCLFASKMLLLCEPQCQGSEFAVA